MNTSFYHFYNRFLTYQSTIEVLKATHELGGKQVKRFVLLGSAVSVLDSFEDLSAPEGKAYTEDDWNPVRS